MIEIILKGFKIQKRKGESERVFLAELGVDNMFLPERNIPLHGSIRKWKFFMHIEKMISKIKIHLEFLKIVLNCFKQGKLATKWYWKVLKKLSSMNSKTCEQELVRVNFDEQL